MKKKVVITEDYHKVIVKSLSGELSKAETKLKYNIESNTGILYWMR